MDELVMVKEEAEIADNPPQPMLWLHDLSPPPFLIKTFEMVEDPETDTVVSWSSAKNSLIVWDSYKFSTTLLPKYFKHSNFSSFIRQLNTYGFRKVDPDRWEFANDNFLPHKKHLLKQIKRHRQVCVEIGNSEPELEEIDKLRRDRVILIAEIEKLRKQHQKSLSQLMALEEHIEGTERKQKNILAFIARAVKNPMFIQQLIHKSQDKEKKKRSEHEIVSEIETLLDAESFEEGSAGWDDEVQNFEYKI